MSILYRVLYVCVNCFVDILLIPTHSINNGRGGGESDLLVVHRPNSQLISGKQCLSLWLTCAGECEGLLFVVSLHIVYLLEDTLLRSLIVFHYILSRTFVR